MEKFETGAVRDTGGKGRMDLLPWCAIRRVSRHMEDALTHYPERNWEKGLPMHSMIDSAFRHLAKYVEGQTDEDHLCAAATNLLMAMWTEEMRPNMQDIPTRSVCCSSNKEPEVVCKEDPEVVCSAYHNGRCWGTREMDAVSCGGDCNKCSEKLTYKDVHDIVEE